MKQLLRCAQVGVSSVRQHPLAALVLCAVTLPINVFQTVLYCSALAISMHFGVVRGKQRVGEVRISPDEQRRFLRDTLLRPSVLQIVIFGTIAFLVSLAKSVIQSTPSWQMWYGGMVDWMGAPVLFYSAAIAFVAATQVALKKLPETFKQRIYDLSIGAFVCAFVCSVISVCMAANGPVTWIGNWLISSALDANLGHMTDFIVKHYEITRAGQLISHEAASVGFIAGLGRFIAVILLFSFLQPAIRLGTLLTSMIKHVGGTASALSKMESAVQEFCELETHVELVEDRPWRTNIVKTCVWTVACYLTLFFVLGFSNDPVGQALFGWLARGSGPHMRIFLASVIALWWTTPLAVSATVFLPYAKSPKIIAGPDGILFPLKLYRQVGFRPFRVWQDIKSFKVTKKKLVMTFHSGGQVKLRLTQVDKAELDNFIIAIENNAARGIRD